jgi:hypothetical protein
VPIQYVTDDASRRIRVTLTDPLTVAELIASVERQLADGAWRYGLLVDARGTFPAPRPVDMRSFAARIRELVATHGPRGPIAIVARESGAIIGAHMYVFLSGNTESIEVFWDVDDARQWLDGRIATGHESSE